MLHCSESHSKLLPFTRVLCVSLCWDFSDKKIYFVNLQSEYCLIYNGTHARILSQLQRYACLCFHSSLSSFFLRFEALISRIKFKSHLLHVTKNSSNIEPVALLRQKLARQYCTVQFLRPQSHKLPSAHLVCHPLIHRTIRLLRMTSPRDI